MTKRILFVDDDKNILNAHERHFGDDYDISLCSCPLEAVERFRSGQQFAVVVSDFQMPRMNGIGVHAQVRDLSPDTTRVLLTGAGDLQTAMEAVNDGYVFRFLTKPCSYDHLHTAIDAALEEHIHRIERRDYTARLEERVRQQTEELRTAHEETIHRLVSASSHRDEETGAHIRRVGLYSQALARALGWSAADAERLKLAAPMHDVGKLGIPDAILQKPGRLTPEEFEIMKNHTQIGAQILCGSMSPVLQLAAKIALGHHEKWDGSGYPFGNSGEHIAEAARIVAVVDVYDALSSDRVYRKAFAPHKVIAMLKEGRGSHHDPKMIDVFLEIYEEIQQIGLENPDHITIPTKLRTPEESEFLVAV